MLGKPLDGFPGLRPFVWIPNEVFSVGQRGWDISAHGRPDGGGTGEVLVDVQKKEGQKGVLGSYALVHLLDEDRGLVALWSALTGAIMSEERVEKNHCFLSLLWWKGRG